MTRDEPYYRRFYEPSIKKAHALGIIDTNQFDYIYKFYKSNEIFIRDQSSLNVFQSFIPNIEILETTNNNFILVKVNEWPHPKEMCLKFVERNPLLWQYVSVEDDEQVLFNYNCETYSVFCPTTVLPTDGSNALGHRSN